MLRRVVLLAGVAVLAIGAWGCHQAILTAPPGSTIIVTVNPGSIPAHGGVSIISAFVVESIGTPVPDGTVVQFFTTLGRIEPQGKTNDGIAKVKLTSDSRSGEAKIRACSGGSASSTSGTGSSATTTAAGMQCGDGSVTIGNRLVGHILVAASPQRILYAPRQAQIVANVYDTDGNPAANVPVIFTVSADTKGESPAPYESLMSRGSPVFTDNNGRAYDTLTTSYAMGEVARWVYVTATAGADGKSGQTTVQIN